MLSSSRDAILTSYSVISRANPPTLLEHLPRTFLDLRTSFQDVVQWYEFIFRLSECLLIVALMATLGTAYVTQ